MILCLTYNSVFLAFFSFPPVTKIKHLSDLALSVLKGDYHCLDDSDRGVAEYFWNTNKESLQVIATDLKKYYLSYGFLAQILIEEEKKNCALLQNSNSVDIFKNDLSYRFAENALLAEKKKKYALFISSLKIDSYRGKFRIFLVK